MTDHNSTVNFIWSVADLLRDHFKRGKYQDVILPFTILRRLDQVLEPTREQVIAAYKEYGSKLSDLDGLLKSRSGFAFYNTSHFNFERLSADANSLRKNLKNYLAGFSANIREDILDRFNFNYTLDKLEEAGILFNVFQSFKDVDLHPDRVDNHKMGYIYEELIRKFNEALNENPGEHFTPREIISLMARLLIEPDLERLNQEGIACTVYDPCCGSGGMLSIAKEMIETHNETANVHLFGQEVNPETYATSKADFFMKDPTGADADRIKFGSTLRKDLFPGTTFDYLIANPPYGKDWKGDKKEVETEHTKGFAGRFGAGLPKISDGQLLFLQHMIAHMRSTHERGSRIAIVMNGSPLFSGDAESGESEIRRWILENDWLDTLIALPEQMFYNTGIATYVWIITNKKEDHRKGKVLLVNGTNLWSPMKKSLGDKRREMSNEHINQIVDLYNRFEEGELCKIFPNTHFGYRKIQVERPLRLNFQVTPERLENLKKQTTFATLAKSKKKDSEAKANDEAKGRELQKSIIELLMKNFPASLYRDRKRFEDDLIKAAKSESIKLPAPLKKAITTALSEPDETAMVCEDGKGRPEPNTAMRDHELVPLSQNINTYFEREVLPHVPDAWINTQVRDHKDGEIGKVGYEINFNRYFYVYKPPRPLTEIESDIKQLEQEIIEMLSEVV